MKTIRIQHESLLIITLAFILFSGSIVCHAFEWINPQPFGVGIADIWGNSPDNLYFSGLSGMIRHWDGTQYEVMNTGYFPYTTWWGIYGISPDNIMAVGGSDDVIHWDGETWTDVSIPGTQAGPTSVWGAETGEYFVVADRGWVWRYVEGIWHSKQIDYYLWLKDVWGLAADNVYVAGYAPFGIDSIYHWDGVEWSPIGDTQGWAIDSLWGYSSEDIWAVGEEGQIYHWDGQSWTFFDPGGNLHSLKDSWGSSSDNIFLAGTGGMVRHFDGENWSANYIDGTDSERGITSLWGIDDSHIYAVGSAGLLYEYDGTDWTNLQTGPIDHLRGVWYSAEDEVFAVGENGITVKWSSTGWEYIDSGVTDDFNDTWGQQDMIYAVGDNGTIIHWNGDSCERMSSGTTEDLQCIRGLIDGSLFAVGANDTVLRFSNSEWSNMSTGYGIDLNGVWAADETNVYVVGEVIDFSMSSIIHWDGNSWSLMPNEASARLSDVYGFAPDDIFAVGKASTILHYDGQEWTKFNLGDFPWVKMNRIGGVSSDNLYAAGDMFLVRFDGTDWIPEITGVGYDIMDMCLGPDNEVYFTGDFGLLMSDRKFPDPCRETGVLILMPSHEFRPGDICACRVTVCNRTDTEIIGHPLFVILDVYGCLYFAPGFTESPDHYLAQYPSYPIGATKVNVIDAFTWPEGAGSAEGIFWYAALTDPAVTEIFGEWDSWEFGWSE